MLLVLVLVVVGVALVYGYGEFRWNSETARLRARLDARWLPSPAKRVDVRELERLPAPVQRYLRTVLAADQLIVAAVTLGQEGTFNLKEDDPRWTRFTATQRVITRQPGFDWNARIVILPGLFVRVHDGYGAGEGYLKAAVLGLLSKANLRDAGDLAVGELMRFLAEAVWYPTLLLPSQGTRWTAVDQHSARATFKDGSVETSLLFHFQPDGLVDTVRAESRSRGSGPGAGSMPWECRLWNYQKRDGLLIPLEGEAAWVTPTGLKPYWRGRITRLAYDFST